MGKQSLFPSDDSRESRIYVCRTQAGFMFVQILTAKSQIANQKTNKQTNNNQYKSENYPTLLRRRSKSVLFMKFCMQFRIRFSIFMQYLLKHFFFSFSFPLPLFPFFGQRHNALANKACPPIRHSTTVP